MEALGDGFEKTRACHYLNGAAECFLEGAAHYNDFRIGKIERSFSEIQRAWNSLWMADTVASDNGDLKPPPKPNKPDKTFGIENFMYKDFLPKNLMSDYDLTKAAEVFKNLKKNGSPIQSNYLLLYELRNLNQHDILEYADGSCSEITDILNPYMVANFFNFIRAYKEVSRKVFNQCLEPEHKKHRASGMCAYKKIIKHNTLESYVSIPTGLRKIDHGSLDKYVKNLQDEPSKVIRGKRRDLQNHLASLVNGNEQKIDKQLLKSMNPEDQQDSMRQWRYDLIDTPVHRKPGNYSQLKVGIKAGIQKEIDDYKYTSLSEIASEILGLSQWVRASWTAFDKLQHKNLRYKIQKIKELLIEDGISDGVFWKDFWGQTRYNTDFIVEINRRRKN